MFFRYTRFLEKENGYLKSRIESLEARNQELVLSMLSRDISSQISEPPKPQLKHTISRLQNKATCTCGWICTSEDPGTLQSEISAHYREGVVPFNRKKSWVHAKAALEGASEEKQ